MLTALQLGNFKSWREVNVPLAPITGFFGTNSSGKSSLLQALLLMKQSAENSDQQQVFDFGGDNSFVQFDGFQSLIFSGNEQIKIHIGFSFNDTNFGKFNDDLLMDVEKYQTISFFSKIGQNEKRNLFVEKIEYELFSQKIKLIYDGKKYITDGFNNLFLRSKVLNNADHLEIFTSETDPIYPWRFYGFSQEPPFHIRRYHFALLETALEKALAKVNYLGPLRDFPKRFYSWSGAAPSNVGKSGEITIAALLAARVGGNKVGEIPLENYLAEKLKDLGLIDSFRLEELREGTNIFRVLVRRTPESPEVSLTDVGFGVSQVLPVLVLCYYAPEGSTILLEQPELHLHPNVQSGLADIFIDAYQKRGVQIILESHSEHLLQRLQRRITEEKIGNADVNLYFCRLEQGESKLESLELDEFGNIHNYPDEFFGDRFAEVVAITEAGISRREKKALEKT